MNPSWNDWWDGLWLYFCILLCSLPVAVPVVFLLRFADIHQAGGGLAVTLAAAYAMLAGPLFVSRVFRSLDGQRRQPAEDQRPADPDAIDQATYQMRCPNCRAMINPLTREGLHSPPGEPWLLICDRCDETIQPEV